MALTVLIKHEDGDLSLTLDAPRIVIGRGKGCEVQIPDPTVSLRHATIRMQGGKNLVVDEGSTNGLLVGKVRLPPQTPRALQNGELIRVGRVWIALSFGAGIASTPREVRGVALAHLQRQLAAEGESVTPHIEIAEGVGAGSALALDDESHEYLLGRASDADLRIEDDGASRHHAAITRQGDGWLVRDLNSKQGTLLDDEPLDDKGRVWADGSVLRIGELSLLMRDPLPLALEEMQAAADRKLRPAELDAPPPGYEPEPIVEAPSEEAPSPTPAAPPVSLAPFEPLMEVQPRGVAFATVDLFVVLVAIGMMGISIAGLMYVLG
jgi:pSer/pThr/pTyr-binding forkhead associated (FHA) protein